MRRLLAVVLLSLAGSAEANTRARVYGSARVSGAAPIVAVPALILPALPPSKLPGGAELSLPDSAPRVREVFLSLPATGGRIVPISISGEARLDSARTPEPGAQAPQASEPAAPAGPAERADDAAKASERLDALGEAAAETERSGDAAVDGGKGRLDDVWETVFARAATLRAEAAEEGKLQIAARVAAVESKLGPAPKTPYRTPAKLAVPLALTRAGGAATEAVSRVFSANAFVLGLGAAALAFGILLHLIFGLRAGGPRGPMGPGGMMRVIVFGMPRAEGSRMHETRGIFDVLRKRAGIPEDTQMEVTLDDSHGPTNAYFGEMPRGPSVIAVGSKVAALGAEEKAGILAHELAHYAHDRKRDLSIAKQVARGLELSLSIVSSLASLLFGTLMSLTAVFWLLGEPVMGLGDFLWLNAAAFGLYVAFSLAAGILELSRARYAEYRADDYAAWLTDAGWIARGLAKIDPAGAHTGEKKSMTSRVLSKVFSRFSSTHPSTAERIRRLKARKN